MTPSIETSSKKKLVGMRLTMSLANNRIGELWRSFAPRRNEIANSLTTAFDNVPSEMETFVLPAGLYAVFHYKGLSTDNSIFQYIFGTWLPGSDYVLDDRPHFEILGDKYKNNDPASEEDIWIPIKPK